MSKTSKNNRLYRIRLANIDDVKNVFDLSNDDDVRINAIHSEKIKWENHIKWFANKIDSKDIIFYILEYKNNFAGYCHIDRENDEWITTIHISKEYRGKSLGYILLKEVCQYNNDKNLISYIKINNFASKTIFKKNDFKIFNTTTINNQQYHILKRAK